MSDLDDIEDILQLSAKEIEKLNKTQLTQALKTVVSNTSQQNPSDKKLDDILIGINNIREEFQEFKTDKQALRQELENVKQENAELREALMHHQRYLESLEAEKRSSNIIVTGVKEQNDIGKDSTEVAKILEEIGVEGVEFKTVTRIGKVHPGQTRPRALKITLADPTKRKSILEKAKGLKDIESYSKVYINKDIHPLVHKELSRLRSVTHTEKEKPENVGKNVAYDHERRVVTVDGTIVDRFKPAFF